MAKILTAEQTRAADQYTIEHEPIASIDLMERASTAFVDWFIERFPTSQSVAIFCGTGNNGGDGLAISRILQTKRDDVNAFVIGDPKKGTQDFKINLERWTKLGNPISVINSAHDFQGNVSSDIIIDGLFGSGLSRPLTEVYAELIEVLNAEDATRIAIDIASGLFADLPARGVIFQPDFTITFQLPKLAFLLPENAAYVGKWMVVDIGLSVDFIESVPSDRHYIDVGFARSLLKPRKKFAHKGDFGKILLIAGSKGKMGAAVLAARACLRAGAGLLTVYVPGIGLDVLQTSVPEAMVLTDPHADRLTSVPEEISGFDTIAVGPGIGQHPETLEMLTELLALVERPMVIDADALNIISSRPELLDSIPVGSILTPHPKEFQRLVGNYYDSFDRLEKQQQLVAKYNLNVLVKGAHSTIVEPSGTTYFNSTGNPGMATAGSGDVLTGVVTGLLAQGYSASNALQLGVYLHGAAGDLAASRLGQPSLMASDIIEELPKAFSSLA
ncbi:MAG: NAD(P)H-hydrate dehydratase [Cyclobacteriaceae bacterium]